MSRISEFLATAARSDTANTEQIEVSRRHTIGPIQRTMVKIEYLLVAALFAGEAASFSSPRTVSTSATVHTNKKSLTSTQATASIDLRANPSLQEFKTVGINVPFGLRQTLLTNARQTVAKRFWVVDNSGSMALWDGHQVAADHGDHATTSCTRWSEVSETVNCHAQLSAALGAPTDFRLLVSWLILSFCCSCSY